MLCLLKRSLQHLDRDALGSHAPVRSALAFLGPRNSFTISIVERKLTVRFQSALWFWLDAELKSIFINRPVCKALIGPGATHYYKREDHL
jgi:hypothetical protein